MRETMTITLSVVNADALPAGTPARHRSSGHNVVVGRAPGLDWTLPDPTLHVSSRHCGLRFDDGDYWLHDLSTNGVFLNGSPTRLAAPQKLADGDRFSVGPYVVEVSLSSETVERTGALDAPPPLPGAGGDRFLAMICKGAGIPLHALSGRERDALATEIGAILTLTATRIADLLKMRAAAKAMTRSASRTVIGPSGNNPLKFVATAPEAVETMLSRKRAGYLDAKASLEDAFDDLKTHELATYAAMQRALARLLDDVAPDTIERKVGTSVFASKKARAWDIFVERWSERDAGENGMLDTFLAYFAEAYDEAARKTDGKAGGPAGG